MMSKRKRCSAAESPKYSPMTASEYSAMKSPKYSPMTSSECSAMKSPRYSPMTPSNPLCSVSDSDAGYSPTTPPHPAASDYALGFQKPSHPLCSAAESPEYSPATPPQKEEEEVDSGNIPNSSQPLFPALWAGDFIIQNRSSTAAFYGLNAYLSTNASTSARREVDKFPATMKWERRGRRSVWPKSFELRSRPSDKDVTVFFFPSLSVHEPDYNSLVLDLIRRDEALRAPVIGRMLEVLVFPSVELPQHCMRFQGKLFLWGVITYQGIKLI